MKVFRDLEEKEIAQFRKWARENYQAFKPIDGCWHPIVQAECVKINEEAEIDVGKLLSDIERKSALGEIE